MENILKLNFIQEIHRKIVYIRNRIFLRFRPEVVLNIIYKKIFNRNINWKEPYDLIEKINWLQVYSDTKMWSICADKYLVRDFVKSRGCEEFLNDFYGVWYNPATIDWDGLPNKFVLKSNHSCGQIMIIHDKDKYNKKEVINTLNKWVNTKYGLLDGQMHYTKIKPCIIAEKLLVNTRDMNKSLVDYKIWCFDGVPECILVVYDRTDSNYFLSLYDMNWNNISDSSFNKGNKHVSGTPFEKPESIDNMIEIARKLSEGFSQVRIDFYDINDKPILGEMTFSTGYGYFSDSYYKYLGTKIDLSKVKKLAKSNYV